jgi:hypothetical protein
MLAVTRLFALACTDFMDIYETFHVRKWRQWSLDRIYEHICADDDFTHCISIGPVSTISAAWISILFPVQLHVQHYFYSEVI